MDVKARAEVFRGSMAVLVLSVLADGPRYGYAIQRRLHLATGVQLKPGTLYPLLHEMENAGLVEPKWERTTGRPRKWYELTEQGRATLRREAAGWQAYLARLQSVVLPAVRHIAAQRPAPEVSRANPTIGAGEQGSS